MADEVIVSPKSRRDQALLLQTLTELYRESLDPETKSSFLEGVRREAALPEEGFFDKLFSRGPTRQYEQPVNLLRSIDPNAQLNERDIRAMSSLAGIAPGTPAHEAFINELSRLKANQRLQDPQFRQTMGGAIPESVSSMSDVNLMNSLRTAAGMGVRDVTKEGGTETSRVSSLTGFAEPVEGAEVKPSSGLLGAGTSVKWSISPDTGEMVFEAGPSGMDIDEWANVQADVGQRAAALEGFARLSNQLAERVAAGEDAGAVQGVTGDMVARVKAGLEQAGVLNRAANWGGAKTVGEMIDKATDSEFIGKTSELSAGLTPLHYLLATTYAAAQGNKEVGKAELQAALAATQNVRSGDPDQIVAALRESLRGLANVNSSYFSAYNIPAPDIEALAPFVFKGGLAQPPPKEPIIPDDIRNAPPERPWTGTLDKVKELQRGQRQ